MFHHSNKKSHHSITVFEKKLHHSSLVGSEDGPGVRERQKKFRVTYPKKYFPLRDD